MYKAVLKGVVALMVAFAANAYAEKIVVAAHGTAASSFPFAVAEELGYLKDAGVTGIIGSEGGGTTVNNLYGSDAPYAEINLGAIVAAFLQGRDLRIVSGNVHRMDFTWIVRNDSKIKSLDDLKGRKIGYTNPRSNTHVVTLMLLDHAKLSQQQVELISFGSMASGISMLERGDIDSMPISEPMISGFAGKYRTLIDTSPLKPMGNAYGVTTARAIKTSGDTIRKVIVAKRRAVQFINANPERAAAIFARTYNVDGVSALRAVNSLLASGKATGIPYWSEGDLNIQTMKNTVTGLINVGALQSEPNWAALIDQQFLPTDLQK